MACRKLNMLIDSSMRDNATHPSTDYNVNLNGALQIVSARLKSCYIPLAIQNITSSENTFSYIILTLFPNTINITIPVGRYNPSSLVTAVNAQLQATDSIDGIVRLSYDANSGRFTFTLTPQINTPLNGHFQVVGNLITYTGFISPNPIDAFKIVGIYTPSFFIAYPSYFRICINYLDANVKLINNHNQFMTFFVENPLDPTTDFFGRTLYIQNSFDDTGVKFNTYRNPVTLQYFQVVLRDTSDNIVTLDPSVDWWFLMELEVRL